MSNPIPLLIIGAGPFGLAMAAYARHKNIEHIVVGKTMDFWRANMPRGMLLRSMCDWHYDPFETHTIERYLESRQLKPADVEPLTLDVYLDYVGWFQKQSQIEVRPAWVQTLNQIEDGPARFEATLDDGSSIQARNVVAALGFRYFKNVPEQFSAMFPEGRWAHTCDDVDFEPLAGKRVLIIGGRQSAFEWAALLREQGAAAVYVSYRHPTPAFQTADWTWVNPLVASMVKQPGWFRSLAQEEKETVNRRLWAEGRLKLEPWLASRIQNSVVQLLPESAVTGCAELPGGALAVQVNGASIVIDHVILATGYKVNIGQVPLLANGNLLARLDTRNGFPALDEHFQSSVPGLYFTSMCATQDFGPFFAFTAAVRTSALLIGSGLGAAGAMTMRARG